MILLKVSMTHCFHTTINLIAIGDFCIFGLQSGFANRLIYFVINIEKYCSISLTVGLIKLFLPQLLIKFYVLLVVSITHHNSRQLRSFVTKSLFSETFIIEKVFKTC